MRRDVARRLARAGAGTALLAGLIAAPAGASIPDPNTSGYGFPASLGACPEPVSVYVTVRDAFVTPEAACSTWVVIVSESGALDPGQATVAAGHTALDGTVTLTFPTGIGGTGSIHFDVLANTNGSGDVFLQSSGAYPLAGSCAGATEVPPTNPAGPWENALAGASPNPFRSGTTVGFTVGVAAEVRLSVHDVTGRRVATLAVGRRSAGSHRVVWNGRDGAGRPVAAGVYLCRLEIGDWSGTRTMQRVR
jgi:hypothetical protein